MPIYSASASMASPAPEPAGLAMLRTRSHRRSARPRPAAAPRASFAKWNLMHALKVQPPAKWNLMAHLGHLPSRVWVCGTDLLMRLRRTGPLRPRLVHEGRNPRVRQDTPGGLQHQAVASHRAKIVVEGVSLAKARNILGRVSLMRRWIRPQRSDQVAMVTKIGEAPPTMAPAAARSHLTVSHT